MPKKDEISFKKLAAQNLIWFAGVAMAVLNLWLAAKLAPLAQGITRLDLRVSAVEKELSVHYSSMDKLGEKLDKVIWEIGELKKSCK